MSYRPSAISYQEKEEREVGKGHRIEGNLKKEWKVEQGQRAKGKMKNDKEIASFKNEIVFARMALL